MKALKVLLLAALLIMVPFAAMAEGKIDINTADEVALQELKGIGEKKAAAIVEYREAHGNFENVDALASVSGIGAKTVEKLRPFITAGAGAPATESATAADTDKPSPTQAPESSSASQ